MYTSVLVPIDPAHLEEGKRVLSLACELGGMDAEITALSVIEPVPGYVAAELPEGLTARNVAATKAALAEIASEAGVDYEVTIGRASQLILDYAHRHGIELIAIASHRPGLEDFFLGSTAARVVRHAKCAVLVDR